tara:strand:+ start:204 stop:758 length:555 start_codon:yes stop_codon:yes gene_type:complete
MARQQKKFIMDMVLEYAKVFPENADMGSKDGHKIAQDIYKKGGQYTSHLYFTSEDQITTLIDNGMQLKPMGNDRILSGNLDYGIGKYIKSKRMVDNLKKFTNNQGEEVEIQYGGAPTVINLTKGSENKRVWDFNKDGLLGNGTKAKVKFELYADGAGIRLSDLVITDQVVYEDEVALVDEDFVL